MPPIASRCVTILEPTRREPQAVTEPIAANLHSAPGAIELASPETNKPKGSDHAVDLALSVLDAHKQEWARLDLKARIDLVERTMSAMQPLGPAWVEASVRAKGLTSNRAGEGEEWLVFAIVLRTLRILRDVLKDVAEHGRPTLPSPLRTNRNGQVVADVFPLSRIDALLHRNVSAEVWMQPGLTVEEVRAGQARAYHQQSPNGKLVLVLGAGNVASLITTDVLYKMFVENAVVVLKPNPVNAYIGPLIERGCAALINAGYLQVVYGDSDVGDQLARDPRVDAIHLTGSDKTFESILFGDQDERSERKATRRPRLDKPFTAELGNVTPVIVVPGPWSQRDLRIQANRLATWFTSNASFNCLTPRVIVQHQGWNQRQAFVQAVGDVLRRIEPRQAYYPGAHRRYQLYLDAHPDALRFGDPGAGQLPWTLIPDLNPEQPEEVCFRSEAFCSVFSETALPAADAADFLDRAVEFANDRLWGTLTASIVIHPASLRQPAVAAALDRALERLRYGMIAVNLRVTYAYYVMVAPWGSHPGHTIYDVQSGIGSVNNLLMFDRPQKSIVRGPFRPWPDFLSADFRHLDEFGRRLACFEADGSIRHLPGLIYSTLRP